jgi:hypothetical protein
VVALLPHARAALTPADRGVVKIVTYLGVIGNTAAALDLHWQTTLTASRNLAYWTRQAQLAGRPRSRIEVNQTSCR